MADQKSKLPDLSEITSMAGKFFNDVKTSISQIIDEYKAKHPKSDGAEKPTTQTTTTPEVKVATTVEEKPKATKTKEPVEANAVDDKVTEKKVVEQNVEEADDSKK